MARILICLAVLALMSYNAVRADVSGDSLCENLKEHGHCSNHNVQSQCPKQCGGGDGGSSSEKKTDKPTDAPEKTTKGSATTKKSSSGKNCDKRSPCVSMDEANSAFHQRCVATNGALKDTCYPHCRYDEDTATMKKAFLGGPCPLSQLRVYLTAASNGKDNTGCCQDKGVLAQKKTGVCGCFCNPTGPVWPQKGEAAKYAPCVSVLQGIMQCHYFAEGAD